MQPKVLFSQRSAYQVLFSFVSVSLLVKRQIVFFFFCSRVVYLAVEFIFLQTLQILLKNYFAIVDHLTIHKNESKIFCCFYRGTDFHRNLFTLPSLSLKCEK